MLTPSFQEFKQLAGKGTHIAVLKTLPADLETPVTSFLKLAGRDKHAFLLESAEYADQIGRYSILGFSPEMKITSVQGKILIERGGRKKRVTGMSILDVLESEHRKIRLANAEEIPGFSGGLVGYFAYENVQEFETIRLQQKSGHGAPQAVFFLTTDFIVFDHYRKTLTLVRLVPAVKRSSLPKAYRRAIHTLEKRVAQLRKPLRHSSGRASKNPPLKLQANMSQTDFHRKVRQIQSYIKAGDCIQVVLSQRFQTKAPADDFRIYRALRSINPSPYMFYFRSGETRLIGSSPELLVRNQERYAEVRPIAGTRPRGETEAKDLKNEENLKKSVKEMAEHLMLVDLGRNDLGRVCEFESVRVKNFARVERYSHVMHLVSDVCGTLKKKKHSFDLLKACFPAGTVSGAPKIRAMEIIDELEPTLRGPYAGALGFFGFKQDMEMCINIRTIVAVGKTMYLQAGAGIVKDSNPSREYEETMNKAKALVQAIERQGSF